MTDKIYTLTEVASQLGDATEDEVRVELEGIDNAAFVAKGRRIGTPRLGKELARNYGIFADWLPKATDDQRELLGFVATDWFRLAVWTGRQAEIRYDAMQTGTALGSAEKDARQADADKHLGQARRTRDRLRSALVHLAGGVPTWIARIDAAYATSTTPHPACDSLLALCDLADTMLADPSKGISKRRKHSTLKPALIQKYRTLAAAASTKAAEAAAVTPKAAVSQAEVDLWDGMAVSFFEQFVEAVEQAREEDPTIPTPTIIGLRSFFGRRSTKKSDAAEESASPADKP